jgi:DNA processing protein
MIREGEALLVTRAEEVIDEAGPLRLSLPTTQPSDPSDRLQGEEASVYAALPGIGSRQPRAIAENSGLDLSIVRAILPALELAGLVGMDENGWHRTANRQSR